MARSQSRSNRSAYDAGGGSAYSPRRNNLPSLAGLAGPLLTGMTTGPKSQSLISPRLDKWSGKYPHLTGWVEENIAEMLT